MTPNDNHANQTISFIRIEQYKMQALSRIVSEVLANYCRLVAQHYSIFLYYLLTCLLVRSPLL